MAPPTTRYASSGEASLAYQVAGEGPLDILFLPGWISQIEHLWEAPAMRRFLERLERPEKHWKFSPADLAERALWDEYMEAYEEALAATSTEWAPWYVIPADHKWVARTAIADILTSAVQSLDLRYPAMSPEQQKLLAEARKRLEDENGSSP